MKQAKNATLQWWHPVGYETSAPTLCIGLDVAWFGGSKNKPDSQYDFLLGTIIEFPTGTPNVLCKRLKLTNRDPDAVITGNAVREIIQQHEDRVKRIILSIDAPLQTNQADPASPRKKDFRRCERHFSKCRKAIDKAVGGSSGWHPNVQPGVPLPKRVITLVDELRKKCGLQLWTKDNARSDRLIIECFPAEAIWAAKRLNQYSNYLTAPVVTAYKRQEGSRLNLQQVRELVETTILDSFKHLTGLPNVWPVVVEKCLLWIMQDTTWQKNGTYRGGKLLDDVVDSAICLATAISYATGTAHVWQDPDNTADGHIIGPGRFNPPKQY